VAVVAAAMGSVGRVGWAGRTDILGELPTPVGSWPVKLLASLFTDVFVLVVCYYFAGVFAFEILDQARPFADAAKFVAELRQVTCHHNE
jgi:hypothetical protein